MTEPLVTFEIRNGYLVVIGHGSRNSLASMVEASEMIFKKLHETNMNYLLVDYTRLHINVHMAEAFNIVKRYETAQPELRNVLIAGAFSHAGLEFANYWKEIGQKRGFSIEIFDDLTEAEKWLQGRISQ